MTCFVYITDVMLIGYKFNLCDLTSIDHTQIHGWQKDMYVGIWVFRVLESETKS